MRRWLAGPLMAFTSTAIVLVVIEVCAYQWERRAAQGPLGWTLVASRRMPLVRHGVGKDSYYLLTPDAHYTWEGIPVIINSRGLRSGEFIVPKPAGVYRILNVGDSVAFGWGVQYEETYGRLLARRLARRTDGMQYEVINAGVPGWNLETASNYMLGEGFDCDPDLVLLEVTIVNDVYGQEPITEGRSEVFDWLRDNTYFWPFVTLQTRYLLARKWGPEAIPVLNPPRNAEAYFPLDENNEIWDQLWESVLEIYRATAERGIAFALVLFPTALQYNSAAHPDVPQRVLCGRASRYDVNVVDLLPVYRKVCSEAGTDKCEEFENLLSTDVWMHPTPLGHSIAAEQIETAVFD